MTLRDASAPTLRLSRCTSCNYDLSGHKQPMRCPECGEALDLDGFDVPVRRVGESLVPWDVVLIIGAGALAVLGAPGPISKSFAAVATVLAIAVLKWRQRVRNRSPERRPRLVVGDGRVQLMRGGRTVGGWPLRMFTGVELVEKAGRSVRLRFHDRLGLSFTVVPTCSNDESRRAHARLTEAIESSGTR